MTQICPGRPGHRGHLPDGPACEWGRVGTWPLRPASCHPAAMVHGIAPSLGTAASVLANGRACDSELVMPPAPSARPPIPHSRPVHLRVRPCALVAPATLLLSHPCKMRSVPGAGCQPCGTVRDGGGLRYILRLLSSSLPSSVLILLPASAPPALG